MYLLARDGIECWFNVDTERLTNVYSSKLFVRMAFDELTSKDILNSMPLPEEEMFVFERYVLPLGTIKKIEQYLNASGQSFEILRCDPDLGVWKGPGVYEVGNAIDNDLLEKVLELDN